MQGVALTDGTLKNNVLATIPIQTSPISTVRPLHPLHTSIADGHRVDSGMSAPLFTEHSSRMAPPSLFNSELISLQIQGYIHPSMVENLRRVSFFDLMKTPPSIHQLCNPDFKDLVEKMIDLQKESTFFAHTTRGTPLEVMDIQSHGGVLAVSETARGRMNSLSQEGISNHLAHDQNQNVPYNHLLHAPQHPKSLPDTQSPHSRTSPQTARSQERHTYFNKKKTTKKTDYSQKLIKSIILTLNTLSFKLSKLLE